MQINRTGYFLLAFFFIGGLIFTVVEFTVFPFPIFLGPIWVITSVGLGIYALAQRRKGRHEQLLWKTGIRGKGTLISASSGAIVNEQPLMTLVLDPRDPRAGAARGAQAADHLQLRGPPDAARGRPARLRQPARPRRHPRRLVSQTLTTLDPVRGWTSWDAGTGAILALAVADTGMTPEGRCTYERTGSWSHSGQCDRVRGAVRSPEWDRLCDPPRGRRHDRHRRHHQQPGKGRRHRQ